MLVRNMLRTYVDYRPYECWTFGSECDGGFAQFAVAPARETYAVESDWSDTDLAAIPCTYSTAENMLHRAGVTAGERVLVTGVSGGVGLAAVQLAKRRGAFVIAVCSPEVADRLDLLRPGGRYAIAGAISGPHAQVNLRTIYPKDLRLLGCTFQDDEVFENLVRYIEANEIRPVVSQTYPLAEIARAQQDFLAKKHTGKLVLLPPPRKPAAAAESAAGEAGPESHKTEVSL